MVLFVAILSIIADGFLFFGVLNRFTAVLSLVVSAALFFALIRRRLPKFSELRSHPNALRSTLYALLTATALVTYLILSLSHNQIITSVRTPFEAMPRRATAAFVLLIALAVAVKKPTLIQNVAVFFYLGLVVMRFPLGYGFDPLLHEAALKAIALTGGIQPLPILYGGQYALVVALHFLTGLDVNALDRFLVPLVAAITLPSFLRMMVPEAHRHSCWPILFLLPLGLLTLTTPFALATLFFIAVLAVALAEERRNLFWIGVPLALASALTHLIAGLPAFAVLALVAAKRKRELVPLAFTTALIVPIAFLVRSHFAGLPVHFAFSLDRFIELLPSSFPTTSYRPFEDLAYCAAALLPILFIFLVWRGLRMKTGDERLSRLLVAACALFISGGLLQLFTFPNVIGYEQFEFGKRLLLLSMLTLTPFVAISGAVYAERFLSSKHRVVAGLSILAVTILAVSHWYLLYPRADRHATSRGFNVSQADFSAARTVVADAGKKPFIILAPQTNSAAFISEFGFPHDLVPTKNGDILPYPIPTGGPLYQYFLDMSAKPDPKIISNAMEFTDRKLVYFILPSYWWDYENVKTKTAAMATGTWDVNKEVTVFKFEGK